MEQNLDEDLVQLAKSRPKLKATTIAFWACIMMLGLAFKIMHWNGSGEMVLWSTSGLSAYLTSILIIFKGKNLVNIILGILAIFGLLFLISSVFYFDRVLDSEGFISYILFFLFMLAGYLAIYRGRKWFQDRKVKSS